MARAATRDYEYALGEPELVDAIINKLSRHFVLLNIVVREGDKFRLAVGSGFLFCHREYSFWVSAGHVIRDIKKLRRSADPKSLRARLVDGSSDKGIPVELDDFIGRTAWINAKGVDIAATVLRPLWGMNLDAAERIWLTPNSSRRLPGWEHLGYALVGAPLEETHFNETRQPNAALLRSRVGVTFLPIRGIRRRIEPGEFWDVPGAFYGELLPLENAPKSILGMSGGPVFAIDRGGRYRLVAVQSAQASSGAPLIRASPISWVVQAIDHMIDRPGRLKSATE